MVKKKNKKIKIEKASPKLEIKSDGVKNPMIADMVVENGKVVTKRKRSGKMYFTKDTENAIIRYNAETRVKYREKIYKAEIQEPIRKLVENVFNTFKFSYFDVGPLDAQKDCLSFLVSNLHKYEADKGKAFSYLSVMAKNYFILQNNNNYKKFKIHDEITDQPLDKKELTITPIVNQKITHIKEFIKLMIDYWEENLNNIFTKKRDLAIANAVIELFRKSDRLENFNKKALYLFVREISDCKTQHITKVINKMKQTQNAIARKYFDTGYVSPKEVFYNKKYNKNSSKISG